MKTHLRRFEASRWWWGVALAGALAVAAAGGAGEGRGPVLEWWSQPAAGVRQRLVLSELRQEEAERYDVQYQAAHRFRGVSWDTLLRAAPPPRGADLALLHFENGMVVPIHVRQASEAKRLGLFIALAIQQPSDDGSSTLVWTDRFPKIAKPGAEGRDPRPIEFPGNKLVVSSLWHPAAPRSTEGGLSPWRYTNALVGLEYVNERAYQRQFDPTSWGTGGSGLAEGGAPVPSPEVIARGRDVFHAACEFCHGVGKRGAHFGWDFSTPIALSQYRSAENLVLHVQYREIDAVGRGHMMPAMPELDADAVRALWQWMAEVSSRGTSPYEPPP